MYTAQKPWGEAMAICRSFGLALAPFFKSEAILEIDNAVPITGKKLK